MLGISYCQAVKPEDKTRAIYYASKPDSRIPGTEVITFGEPGIKLQMSMDKIDAWALALQSKNRNEALKIIKKFRPETYVCKRRAIYESFESEFGHATKALFTKFNIPFIDVWDGKTHAFVGPTKLGKTNFALAHFKHPVHITSIQNFGRISENPDICDGLVIDDVNISKLPCHDVIRLFDTAFENNINIKYGTGYIPAWMPRIVCLNNIDYLYPRKATPEVIEAIARRLVVHKFENKLYDNEILMSDAQRMQRTYQTHHESIISARMATVKTNVVSGIPPVAQAQCSTATAVDEDP